MILPVVLHPNPILRQKATPVDVFDANLQRLVNDMFETMAQNQGVGLAANQVGVLQRVLVIEYKKRRTVLINPVIEWMEGEEIGEEGCLSLPNLLVNVKRAPLVVVKAFNAQGKPIRLKEKGFFARIIQHEMDHLDGILIIDKEEK